MRKSTRSLAVCAVAFCCAVSPAVSAGGADLRKEYAATLFELSRALLDRQIRDDRSPDFGAIRCAHCDVLHTRAAETVFPFARVFSITGDSSYLRAAIATGNWLIRQQEENGSWKETPEEWTGTTTDQLLMMILACESLSGNLPDADRKSWLRSIERAADYLANVMSPEFASINYVATTSATLAAAERVVPGRRYREKAEQLARRTVAKMDEDGFINGEGGRDHTAKSGVDLGYDMEMSLWGLGYYARLTGDAAVAGAVRRSLANHLSFIYPDGSMDGSWGIRSNKWTAYGGATSDGCQVLFSLFASDDPRYGTAALKNLQFVRGCMKEGMVGYGPHHWQIFTTSPCIYPTFAKAKNLAMAHALETGVVRAGKPLPSEETGWMRRFPTLNVVQVRTAEMMATVTAYGYKDQRGGAKSKYMYRPSGGAASNLWVVGHGFLQASSVTIYSRPEPMHFPEAPGIRSLTSRIEYSDSLGYFTNLFEFDGRIETETRSHKRRQYVVRTTGELKDKNWLPGGIGYQLEHAFTDHEVRRTVRLIYHDAFQTVRIVEPIIDYPGMTYAFTGPRTVRITAGNRLFEFALVSGDAELKIGEDRKSFWAPYPALKAFPIELVVAPPAIGYEREVSYRLTVIR
jgi:hypothetical protein